MSIKNRYIYVESSFESELVQTLLFEAGASWVSIGQNTISVFDTCILIDKNLKMFIWGTTPLSAVYKELSLLELVNIIQKDDSVENNTLHICKFSDNHISFEDSEVAMTPEELTELLPIIQSISHRDFEITTRDEEGLEDEERFPITNLTINFK